MQMKYGHKIFLCLALILILARAALAADAANDYKTIVLSEASPLGKIDVTIYTVKYSSAIQYRNGNWWGTDDSLPKVIVAGIDVMVGGNKISMRMSSFCDLAEAHTFNIELTENGFDLVIKGSDAAGAYDAVLSFEGNYLKRRKVAHGEFPDQVWEETVYSWNTLEN